MAELLADPELRLAWSEASGRSLRPKSDDTVQDVLHNPRALRDKLGGEPSRRDGSERQEPKTAEPPVVEAVEQVVRPPGDERPWAERLADPELILAWSEASGRDGRDERRSPAEQPDARQQVGQIMAQLEEEGHAPQRHEGQVIRPSALVEVYTAVVGNETYEAKRRKAEADGRDTFRIDLPLYDVLGPDCHELVFGVTRHSSAASGWREHRLTQESTGIVRAVFGRPDAQSWWRLLTMYPTG